MSTSNDSGQKYRQASIETLQPSLQPTNGSSELANSVQVTTPGSSANEKPSILSGDAQLTTITKFYNEDDDQTNVSGVNSGNGSTSGGLNNQMQSVSSKTSDYESGESPTNSDCNSDTDKLQLRVINPR